MSSVAQEARDHVAAIVAAPTLAAGPFSALTKRHARYLQPATVLEICVRLAATAPGCIMEFGVATGASTRVLRRLSQKEIYALDSFEGLREKFERAEIGTFAGPVPDIPNVNFVKGYFEETCDAALAARVGRVAFASFDADLYSSTLFALHWLTPLLGDGSLILFDEFTGEAKSEARALAEWQAGTGIVIARIAEFDREPSGWGDIPDKRVLFQVLSDNSMPQQPIVWSAKTATFLKVSLDLAINLSDAEKVRIERAGKLTADRFDVLGDHIKLYNVQLNNKPLRVPDWFIWPPDWEMLSAA